MPVFFVIFVGWFLKKIGIIRKDFQDPVSLLTTVQLSSFPFSL